MRYKVPHYIEREAKILGPASFSQLGYLAVAAFVILLLFVVMGGTSAPFFIVSFFVSAVGVAFAFFQKDGEPLSVFIKKAIFFSVASKRYLWKQKNYIIKAEARKPLQRKKEVKEEVKKDKTIRRGRLEEVNRYIESS
jgi:hypothetical protein